MSTTERPMAGTAAQVAEAERLALPDERNDDASEMEARALKALERAEREDRAETPEALADEVKLMPNGQIRLVVGGTLHLLRVPNMGQMRRYRSQIIEIVKQGAAEATALAESAAEARGGEVSAVERMAQQLEADESTDRLNDALLGLMQQIVGDLDTAGRPLDGDTALLPPWLASVGLVSQFVQHWRRVPQAPGR